MADKTKNGITGEAKWDAWLHSNLKLLEERHLVRHLHPIKPGRVSVQGLIHQADFDQWCGQPVSYYPTKDEKTNHGDGTIKVTLFSTNDYLGLSCHPLVVDAMTSAATRYGNGPRSSALVGGYTYYHQELEAIIAELKETEEALVFPSGFAANTAFISVMSLGGDVDIFSDQLNHASIVDGIRLGRVMGKSGIHTCIYRHNNMDHLESLLQHSVSERPANRRLIITDSLFSMDGDFADLPKLVTFKQRYGCILAIDEAHATLVCGRRGGGAAEVCGVQHHIDVHIGTLSKAIGSQGGFIACTRSMKNLLLNKGRSIVFSTALPIPSVVAATKAIQVGMAESWRREHLSHLSRVIRSHVPELMNTSSMSGYTVQDTMIAQGMAVEMKDYTPSYPLPSPSCLLPSHACLLPSPSCLLPSHSPIIPVVLGSEEQTMQVSQTLLRYHFMHVPGIRPPTVPQGSSRLRISISADHTTEDIDQLVSALNQTLSSGSTNLQGGNNDDVHRSKL